MITAVNLFVLPGPSPVVSGTRGAVDDVVLHVEPVEPVEERTQQEDELLAVLLVSQHRRRDLLVQQHAAALALPGRAPAAAGVIRLRAEPVGHNPTHAHNLAQVARLEQLLNL